MIIISSSLTFACVDGCDMSKILLCVVLWVSACVNCVSFFVWISECEFCIVCVWVTEFCIVYVWVTEFCIVMCGYLNSVSFLCGQEHTYMCEICIVFVWVSVCVSTGFYMDM